jgi:hypothetical protein
MNLAKSRGFITRLSFEKKFVTSFFILFFSIGMFVLPNVGIAWDEPGQRLNAGIALIEVAKKVSPNSIPEGYTEFKDDSWLKIAPLDHGVAFDAPVLILEHLLGLKDTRHIYVFHHLMNFLAFFVGAISVFLMSRFRFKNWKIAIASTTFFVLSPRIFADAFYNSKDITFMCFLALSSYFAVKFIVLQSRRYAFFAGLIGGFATDIRVLGVVQIPIVLLFALLWFLSSKEKAKKVKVLVPVYVGYPHIWPDPVGRFFASFQSLSKYNWKGENRYFGNDISASDLPWHYLPTWIGITTPILYSFFFFVGFCLILWSGVKLISTKLLDEAKLQDLFYLAMFTIPLVAIITINATLYDGWRHVFFIYPYFVLILSVGIVKVHTHFSHSQRISRLLISALIAYFIWIASWMTINNPHQNLYFNFLAGKNLSSNWEMDYWGLSNKEALEFILENDNSSSIKVREISFTPLEVSAKIISAKDRDRLEFNIPINDADYLINNYRLTNPEKYLEDTKKFVKIKDFLIDGEVFLTIYRKSSK